MFSALICTIAGTGRYFGQLLTNQNVHTV